MNFVRTLTNLIRPRVRRYEAAGGGRRWDRGVHHGSFNSEALAAAPAIRSRARHFAVNNPWAANGVNAWTTALVGSGIVPASQHPNRETRRALASAFRQWTEQCDADGLTDFYGLQAAAARSLVIDGEAFIQILETDRGVQLRLIPADQIDSYSTGLTGGAGVVGGIEFDSTGRRVAYHVFRHPQDGSMGVTTEKVRVPAEDMIHLFVPSGPGQVRGVSWLAPIMLRLGELDQLEDALLVGAKVAAMMAGFLIDQNNTGAIPFDGSQSGNILETGLEPGTLKVLPGGYDIRFSTPQQAQQSIEFAQLQLRAVAAGLGVPEHLLTGDLRQANYSSLRAALVSFRQNVERLQYHTLVPQMLRPVWRRVITSAVLSGTIEAADFESASADYLSAEFYPPAAPWVDPLKDAEAEAALIAAGLKSRRQSVAERGFNIEDLDSEIAADKAREKQLGLTFNNKPATAGVPNGPQPGNQ